jgi:short-subunit dehydrogenase
VLLARREDRLQEVADETGGEAEVVDVADRAAVEAVAERVLERHPRIGLLVNNAGVSVGASFLRADPARMETAMAINYFGSVWCLLAFLPGLEAGAPSHLVNVVSVAGTLAGGPYSATKHAQLAFSRSVTAELAPRGIAVHTVNPGFVETEGFPQRTRLAPALRRLVADPPLVAERILGAIDRGSTEIFVPRWYRPGAWVQALAPGTLALARRRGVGRGLDRRGR